MLNILYNLTLALISSISIAYVYKITHSGLSYSQSLTHTIVFVGVIVAIVIMVVSGSLSRAFAMVGAMSIIRFRTVLKDTKDVAYIFSSLALGMAAGIGSINIWLVGLIFTLFTISLLTYSNFGSISKSDYLLKLRLDKNIDTSIVNNILSRSCKLSKLLHAEPSENGDFLLITYDLTLKDKIEIKNLVFDLNDHSGVSEITLIMSKNDVDY